MCILWRRRPVAAAMACPAPRRCSSASSAPIADACWPTRPRLRRGHRWCWTGSCLQPRGMKPLAAAATNDALLRLQALGPLRRHHRCRSACGGRELRPPRARVAHGHHGDYLGTGIAFKPHRANPAAPAIPLAAGGIGACRRKAPCGAEFGRKHAPRPWEKRHQLSKQSKQEPALPDGNRPCAFPKGPKAQSAMVGWVQNAQGRWWWPPVLRMPVIRAIRMAL